MREMDECDVEELVPLDIMREKAIAILGDRGGRGATNGETGRR